MQQITFGPEADDAFLTAVSALCALTPAVTVTTRNDEVRDVVLVSSNMDTLMVEEWDEAHGVPSGELTSANLADIVEIRVV